VAVGDRGGLDIIVCLGVMDKVFVFVFVIVRKSFFLSGVVLPGDS
jgi:hypothetical protein